MRLSLCLSTQETILDILHVFMYELQLIITKVNLHLNTTRHCPEMLDSLSYLIHLYACLIHIHLLSYKNIEFNIINSKEHMTFE